MPGAYAHITMAFQSINPFTLRDLDLDEETVGKLMDQLSFFLLGAISPDMPYLVGFGNNTEAIAWADRMHQQNVAERIGVGVNAVANMTGDAQNKCLAWLLGFVEHVVFDVFMHPVVNVIAGGQYSAATKDTHQWCEMNQDVHILLREFGIHDVSNAQIVRAVIKNLHAPFDNNMLDADILQVFDTMLRKADQDLYAYNVPDISHWYESFVTKMSLQEGRVILSGLGRHVGCQLVYPAAAQRNPAYIGPLPVPKNTSLSHLDTYDALFDHARTLVADYWKKVTGAVIGLHQYDPNWFADWNLDTGECVKRTSQFWR